MTSRVTVISAKQHILYGSDDVISLLERQTVLRLPTKLLQDRRDLSGKKNNIQYNIYYNTIRILHIRQTTNATFG